MATGDQADFQQRLIRLMPDGWFANGQTPLRDALLLGIANAFSFIYSLLAYARLQTRIATATDFFLDIIAFDFFGGKLSRVFGQSDSSFRAAIISLLFRKRCTRQAIIAVIQQLLGVTPIVIEPARASDVGCLDETLYLDTVGVLGSDRMPLQAFVQIPVQLSQGANIAGYGSSVGGYSTPSRAAYLGQSSGVSQITIDSIAQALDSVRPVSGKIYFAIIPPIPRLTYLLAEDGLALETESGVRLIL